MLAFWSCYWQIQSKILPGNYSNDAAPSEPNATAIAQTHVKTVSTPLDLGEDFSIVLRNACRQGLPPLLGLRRGAS
jgi:hypothetical protein